jgi:hypothetical protein
MADAPRTVFRQPTAPSAAVPAASRTVVAPPARPVPAVGTQNLPMGLVAGLAAAAVGAAVWALVTVLTEFQIGWMAVGVGFLVGWAVRLAGKGSTPVFGVVGAALALGGCLAGNLLTICIVGARQLNLSVTEMIARLTPALTRDLMWETSGPIDLLFYALALYAGYRYSILPPDAPAA